MGLDHRISGLIRGFSQPVYEDGTICYLQITEKDEEVLEHLIDISVEELGQEAAPQGEEEEEDDEPEEGFRLTFTFEANSFFTETVLVSAPDWLAHCPYLSAGGGTISADLEVSNLQWLAPFHCEGCMQLRGVGMPKKFRVATVMTSAVAG